MHLGAKSIGLIADGCLDLGLMPGDDEFSCDLVAVCARFEFDMRRTDDAIGRRDFEREHGMRFDFGVIGDDDFDLRIVARFCPFDSQFKRHEYDGGL